MEGLNMILFHFRRVLCPHNTFSKDETQNHAFFLNSHYWCCQGTTPYRNKGFLCK